MSLRDMPLCHLFRRRLIRHVVTGVVPRFLLRRAVAVCRRVFGVNGRAGKQETDAC